MGKSIRNGHDNSSQRPVYLAILALAAGERCEEFERMDATTRARAIDLLESLGYLEVGDDDAIAITSLGVLKLRDLRHANDDER